jgi:hypothetical protein
MSETRSDSLRREIQELTGKVRELRMELEELVRRPRARSEWRMLSSHGERAVAHDSGRRSLPADASSGVSPQPFPSPRPRRSKKK